MISWSVSTRGTGHRKGAVFEVQCSKSTPKRFTVLGRAICSQSG